MAIASIPYRESRWDLFLAAILLVSGGLVLRAAQDSALWSSWFGSDVRGPSIGQLNRLHGNIRWRHAGGDLWLDSSLREDVSAGDLVHTGDDGTAGLKIQGMPEVQLMPRALVVVAETKAPARGSLGEITRAFFGIEHPQQAIELQEGTLRVALKSADQPIRVKLRGRVFELGAQAGADGTAEVGVDSVSVVDGKGAFDLREVNEKEKTSLKVGEYAEVGREGALRSVQVPLRAVRPDAGAILFGSVNQDLTFEVSWNKKAPGVELIWEKDGSQLGPKAIALAPGQTTVTIPMDGGNFHWFMRWADGRTADRRFTVVTRAAPTVLGPMVGAGFVSGGASVAIPLRWEAIHPELRAEVQFERVSDQKLEERFGERGGILLDASPGSYRWRVRTLDPKSEASPWTEWRGLQVLTQQEAPDWKNPLLFGQAAAPAKPAPKVKAPPKAVVAAAKVIVEPKIELLPTLEISGGGGSTRLKTEADLKRVKVQLAWKPVPGIGTYHVTVFKPDGSSWIDKDVSDPKLEVIVTSLKDVRYTYQVRATLPGGKSVQSSRIPVSIDLSPPVPLLPKRDAEMPGDHQVLMTWEKTSLTKTYKLQIATEPTFAQPVVEKDLVQNFFGFTPPSTTTYFWRVKAETESKTSGWSSPSRFTVK